MSRLLLLLGLCIWLVGCGGGSATLPMTSQEVRAKVQWPERSRDVAPSSALSVRVRILSGASDGTDLVFGGNRGSLAAHEETYTARTSRTGNFTFTIDFFSLEDGGGEIVAEASGVVHLSGDTNLPNVTIENRIASLSIPAGQAIQLDVVSPIAVESRDAEGNLVAITPGSYSWSIVDGSDRIEKVDGGFQGIGLGVAVLQARVDGLISASQTVTVFQDVTLRINPLPGSWIGFENGDAPWAPMEQVSGEQFRGRVTDSEGRYSIGLYRVGLLPFDIPATVHLTVAEATSLDLWKSAQPNLQGSIHVQMLNRPADSFFDAKTNSSFATGFADTFDVTFKNESLLVTWLWKDGVRTRGAIRRGFTAPQTYSESIDWSDPLTELVAASTGTNSVSHFVMNSSSGVGYNQQSSSVNLFKEGALEGDEAQGVEVTTNAGVPDQDSREYLSVFRSPPLDFNISFLPQLNVLGGSLEQLPSPQNTRVTTSFTRPGEMTLYRIQVRNEFLNPKIYCFASPGFLGDSQTLTFTTPDLAGGGGPAVIQSAAYVFVEAQKYGMSVADAVNVDFLGFMSRFGSGLSMPGVEGYPEHIKMLSSSDSAIFE